MTCAVPVMEVGPPGSPSRRRAQTAAVSCRSRAGVGSDCGKGPQSAGQVCDEKANVCEPLLTHRNVERWHRNRGLWVSPGQRHAFSGGPSVRGRSACCPGGVRCIGGASSSRALAWNRRTCRLECGVRRGTGRVSKGDPHAAVAGCGRVPTRGTGADRPVVVTKAL